MFRRSGEHRTWDDRDVAVESHGLLGFGKFAC